MQATVCSDEGKIAMVWMPLIWVLAVSTRYVKHNKQGKPKKINYCCTVHTFNLYIHDTEIKTGEILSVV